MTEAEKRRRRRRHRLRALQFGLLHAALWIVVPILWLWMRSWRYRLPNRDAVRAIIHPDGPVVLAMLHGHLMPVFGLGCRRVDGRRLVGTVLTSPSRDGQLIGEVARRMGHRVVTGTAKKRGTEALMALRQALRGGGVAGITVDGPRGPRGVPRGGSILLARSTGARLYVLAASARPAIRFDSWDRFLLPLPFATVDMRVELFRDYGADRARAPHETAALQAVFLRHLEAFGESTDGITRLAAE